MQLQTQQRQQQQQALRWHLRLAAAGAAHCHYCRRKVSCCLQRWKNSLLQLQLQRQLTLQQLILLPPLLRLL
jgi:hypothetical protein